MLCAKRFKKKDTIAPIQGLRKQWQNNGLDKQYRFNRLSSATQQQLEDI